MNVEALLAQKTQIEETSYKTFGGRGEYKFNIIKIGSLRPGRYPMRFLWTEPTKNPNGCQLVSTHGVLTDPANKKKTFFLAAECLPANEAYTGIAQILKKIDDNGIYKKLKANPSCKSLCKVIDDLSPWRRWWFPMMIWADEVPPEKEGDYSTYSPRADTASFPRDCILEINFEVKIITAIWEAWKANPRIADPDSGHTCYIVVDKNRYYLEVAPEPSPLPQEVKQFISDNYPDLPKKMKAFFYKDPAEIVGICRAQWWMRRDPANPDVPSPFERMNLLLPEPTFNDLPSVTDDLPAAG